MEAGVKLARETDARGLFLETEPSNAAAQALYERMGFSRNSNFFYGLDL